tara:strand:- start:322 stop:558 length:237 start_codon:yes stop_codon:yes gene_type:complete
MIIIPTKQDLNKNHNDSPKGDKNNRHIIPMKLQGVIRNPFAFLLAVGRAFSGPVGTLPFVHPLRGFCKISFFPSVKSV